MLMKQALFEEPVAEGDEWSFLFAANGTAKHKTRATKETERTRRQRNQVIVRNYSTLSTE
jgi:hypothetical protein